MVLAGEVTEGATITLDAAHGELTLETSTPAAPEGADQPIEVEAQLVD
jgi:hypothetical protein